MPKTLQQYYDEERTKILKNCTACGQCVQKCPAMQAVEEEEYSPREVQLKVLDFLKNGTVSNEVYTRAYGCMECFGCVKGQCPQGLNPLLMNEIIKWAYNRQNIIPITCNDLTDKNAKQRVLSSIQVPKETFQKIFTPSEKKTAKYVFFPGCNVYHQPDKLLQALDILDMIGEDYAFIPGLDYCCCNNYIVEGETEKAYASSQELVAKIAEYNPEAVIFWCPTCLCRFDMTVSKLFDTSFEMMSLPQYITQNMHKLPFKKAVNKTVTLHEACKATYMGLDEVSVREIIRHIPGVTFTEMLRHGAKTVCCGNFSMGRFPDAMQQVMHSRLQEAEDTGADVMVDVCHACHNLFAKQETRYNLDISNYISLLAKALGVGREDKYKQYKKWGDPDRILEDAAEFVEQSDYSREIIERVVKDNFT